MNRCVIFDLDGTLADTIKDIANSVNLTRQDYGLEPLPIDTVVGYTGNGARKLLERSFSGHEVNLDEALEKMIRHYYEFPVVYTTLYPGVAEGLNKLKSAGWKLAVFTNKPGIVAREIFKTIPIKQYFDEIIGGGDGFALKPDPEAIFFLLKKWNADPKSSWVLGDHYTDMNVAKNAGLNGAFAAWGFGYSDSTPFTIKVSSFTEFTDHLLEK